MYLDFRLRYANFALRKSISWKRGQLPLIKAGGVNAALELRYLENA